MAQSTQIVEGVHLVKAGGAPSPRVVIPEALANGAQIRNGTYVGVMRIGACIVFCPVQHVTEQGMPEEMYRKFEAAVREWQTPANAAERNGGK